LPRCREHRLLDDLIDTGRILADVVARNINAKLVALAKATE